MKLYENIKILNEKMKIVDKIMKTGSNDFTKKMLKNEEFLEIFINGDEEVTKE